LDRAEQSLKIENGLEAIRCAPILFILSKIHTTSRVWIGNKKPSHPEITTILLAIEATT
jgi:hypothetical protein